MKKREMVLVAGAAIGVGAIAHADPQSNDPFGPASVQAVYGFDLSYAGAATETSASISADGLEGDWNGYTGGVMNDYPQITPDRRPAYMINLGGQKNCDLTPFLLNSRWYEVDPADWDDGVFRRGCHPTLTQTESLIQGKNRWWADYLAPLPAGIETSSSPASSNMIYDGLDWLIWKLDLGYEMGWRRFVFLNPAGQVNGHWFPSSFWWTLDPHHRDQIELHLASWISTKNASMDPADHVDIGIYGGFKQIHPADLSMLDDDSSMISGGDGADGAHIDTYTPLFTDRLALPDGIEGPVGGSPVTSDGDLNIAVTPRSDHQYLMNCLKANTEPWIDVGITEFWLEKGFDTGDEDPTINPGHVQNADDIVDNPEPWYMRARLSPDFVNRGVRLNAEPPMMDPYTASKHGSILNREGDPLSTDVPDNYLDTEALTLARGVGTLKWFESMGAEDADWRDGHRNLWKVDPTVTEIHVTIQDSEAHFGWNGMPGTRMTRAEWPELFEGYANGGFIPWVDWGRLTEFVAWVTPHDDLVFDTRVLPPVADRCDLDRDGVIEFTDAMGTAFSGDDFVLWDQMYSRVNYNLTMPPLPVNQRLQASIANGDFNYDGEVNYLDLNIMIARDGDPTCRSWSDKYSPGDAMSDPAVTCP